jgi:hypothetical protein
MQYRSYIHIVQIDAVSTEITQQVQKQSFVICCVHDLSIHLCVDLESWVASPRLRRTNWATGPARYVRGIVLALAIVILDIKTTNISLFRDLAVDDSRDVEEEFLAVILGLYEAESLVRIKKFHGSAGAHLHARRSTLSTSSCSCTSAQNAAAPAPCVGGKSREWNCGAQSPWKRRFFGAEANDDPRRRGERLDRRTRLQKLPMCGAPRGQLELEKLRRTQADEEQPHAPETREIDKPPMLLEPTRRGDRSGVLSCPSRWKCMAALLGRHRINYSSFHSPP